MEIETQKTGHVFLIEFNRPEKKNAITSAMYRMLDEALTEAENDRSIRVILLAGKPDVFTAGNDLQDFLDGPPQNGDSPVFAFMQHFSCAAKPVIAAVAGPAAGIGTTMLLHCDLVYAAENARFVLPFTQLGLCPEFGSSLLLPQLAGFQRAAEKLLLGEPFGAEEAREIGLVNRVLPLGELLAYAQARAENLAMLPPEAVRATRRLMRTGRRAALESQMQEEIRSFGELLVRAEAKEAFAAFAGKRRPDFSKFS